MTTGTLDQSHLADFQQIRTSPGGVVTNLAVVPVGFSYIKSWSGGDYPASKPASQYQKWYYVVDDGKGGLKSRYSWRFVKPPRRTLLRDHSYTSNIRMWHDQAFGYAVYTRPQHDVLSYTTQRTFRGLFGDYLPVKASSAWTANDTLKLQGKLQAKIAGSDFNMGVFLGESHQTLQLISGSATKLYKAYKQLRKGNLVGVADALQISRFSKQVKHGGKAVNPKDLANIWLEIQYGWLPLVEDTYGAAQSLAQQLNFPFQAVYRVRSTKPLVPTSQDTSITNPGNWWFRGNTKAQLIARLSEVNVAQLNGLTDPASVLWELTPWSFVADWFIPIGSWLEARSLASALTGTFVTTISEDARFYCGDLDLGPETSVPHDVEYEIHSVITNRTVSTTLQVPFPNIKSFGQVASWKHCANAVALLTQKFGSRSGDMNSALRPIWNKGY